MEDEGYDIIYSTSNVDYRGSFKELYSTDNRNLLRNSYFPNGIRQVSEAISFRNVFRGFHFQPGMNKAIRVLNGSLMFYLCDMRPNSETFGRITSVTEMPRVSERSGLLFIRNYMGVGYFTHENDTTIEYFHSDTFKPEMSYAVRGFDLFGFRDIATVSEKDKTAMTLADWKTYALDNGIFV